jgi:predicted transcriptional regulator
VSKRQKSEPTMSDQLRQAILDSGLSVYAVAKGSGVSQPVIARFVAGERDIRMATADQLFAFFRMRATEPKPPTK